jgi:hypothetical protein
MCIRNEDRSGSLISLNSPYLRALAVRCPLRPFLLAEDVSTASFFDVLEPGQAGIKAANRPNGEAEPAGSPFEPFSQWVSPPQISLVHL